MAGKHRRAALALAVTVMLLPATLFATTVLRLGTQDLVEVSPIIVLGEVLEQETRLFEDGGFPVTYTTVVVEETLKGSTPSVIEIFTLGGQVDDLIGQADGVAKFEPGERVFLFLTEKEEMGENTYDVYGWFQGKWSVVADETGTEYLVNQHVDQLLASPANEVIALDELGRFRFEEFMQAVRVQVDKD